MVTKIIQTNPNRFRAAQDMLYVTAKELNSDILVVRTEQGTKQSRLVLRRTRDAAIKVLNNKVAVQKTGRGTGYVWIKTTNYTLYSCYISPNFSRAESTPVIANIALDARRQGGQAIISGDLNGKIPEWGETRTDAREDITEWAARLNLVCANRGSDPTFERGNYLSILDITMVTPGIAAKINDWRVLDKETLTHHRYIMYSIRDRTRSQHQAVTPEWATRKLNKTILLNSIADTLGESPTAEELMESIEGVCNAAIQGKSQPITTGNKLTGDVSCKETIERSHQGKPEQMLNQLSWKTAKLVLVKKPGKPIEAPSSYRPLCMIDTMGKDYEQLILSRLKDEIARCRGLSDRQYGFREG
ncbi:PREDICTED: uncharacterized protein LOC108559190 [Nicrophorus vespilloides]|uniref:Uncharacterized protein LOC108559190 n=1 Tax=Nicrophorus vespilloides TaxID=110193 RepID=A0ABM1MBA6_NICVS|nr:PREDICTED: uncharacterized protein LOC108559190 [Nicrophorus vespilloides]